MKKISKINTVWNLKLLYTNLKDPQIEKDVRATESAYDKFSKKYTKRDYTATPQKLAHALWEYEQLAKKFGGQKPWWYHALAGDVDTQNDAIRARAARIQQRLTVAANKLVFFKLRIGTISKSKQKIFLKHPSLKPYTYLLDRIFKAAKHQLSIGEEQLENILEQPAYEMWVDGQEKLLSGQTVDLQGKKINIAQAVGIVHTLSHAQRQKLYNAIHEKLRSISYFAESELNAIGTYKKLMDDRRKFDRPYSNAMLEFETSERNAEEVIKLITNRFDIAHRFYRLHANILKQKKLTMADRNVAAGIITKKFNFPATVEIVREAFENVHPDYAKILLDFLKNGHVDAFPRLGKKGGAYCWGVGDFPTFVLLNHTGDVRSVETLGHEMGHAIHTELSKKQPPLYQKYSILTAEVASTFFEQVVSNRLESRLSESERIIFLHNKLLGDISTIFRQIACFNFENDFHKRIRTEGYASKDEIARMLQKHMQSYTGSAIEVTEDDGYYFVYWSHIRRFFYVYSYAYGQLVSRALYAQWKENPGYERKIRSFLEAGKSMGPDNIFKSIGIDTSRPAFFEAGLKSIERDIARLEQMIRK